MPLLIAYVVVSVASLVAAASANGGGAEVLGRVLTVFLSLPWGLTADYFDFREGTGAALALAAGGMVINSLLLWAVFGRTKENGNGGRPPA